MVNSALFGAYPPLSDYRFAAFRTLLPLYAQLFEICRRSTQGARFMARNVFINLAHHALSALVQRRLRSGSSARKMAEQFRGEGC